MPGERLPVLLVALLIALTGLLGSWTTGQREAPPGELLGFGSYGELARYLDASRAAGAAGSTVKGRALPTAPWLTSAAAGPAEVPYSPTNVQVAGVDELDRVKTDGRYIYIASGEEVVVLRARTAGGLAVAARISSPSASPVPAPVVGLFLAPGRLAVVTVRGPGAGAITIDGGPGAVFPGPAFDPGRTDVAVYDVTKVEAPRLAATFSVSGSPVGARMVGAVVYVIAQELIAKVEGRYRLPAACVGGRCGALDPGAIRYDPAARGVVAFTTVLAVDLVRGASGTTAFVTGPASTLYMAPGALYLTVAKEAAPPSFVGPLPGAGATTVYRLAVAGTALRVKARGDVPGTPLNQFALDEAGEYLRVATWGGPRGRATNVYILDGALRPVGALEGLAPGEFMHAARFVGDRLYLVTFEKVDPLLVVDLAEPRRPRLLGSLEIPGFSDYVHPLGGSLLLGVGKDTVAAEQGNFSWYQGLKLSLFDVADVARPRELARYVIGDRGTSSGVLGDHRAFLHIASRGLVVLPVDLALIDPAKYPGGVPPFAYGDPAWQGAYVLAVGAEGIALRGRIAHGPAGGPPPLPGSPWAIERALCIGDDLYTISPAEAKVNALADLAEIAALVYAGPGGPAGPTG